MRGETRPRDSVRPYSSISIRSPHARGDVITASNCAPLQLISIHSPHTRGDCGKITFTPYTKISIHSPHTRGDGVKERIGCHTTNFNPLPSHEGRRGQSAFHQPDGNISIHSPHTRGDNATCDYISIRPISIHSPHTRGDTLLPPIVKPHFDFNPLPSHEGRPFRNSPFAARFAISIHTPHTRGDNFPSTRTPAMKPFQSTPLTRGETLLQILPQPTWQFQSTPLTRGETRKGV